MPSPRLIDPAVFYDVVKIRKAVDEATEDSVRASTGLSTTALNNSMGRLDSMFGSQGPGSKLSKERIFKIRQKAVKLLAKAYILDEVAASVATMQSTSSLEDVASHVMKRDGQDPGTSLYTILRRPNRIEVSPTACSVRHATCTMLLVARLGTRCVCPNASR